MGTPQDRLNLEGAEPLPPSGLNLSGAEPLPRPARRRAPAAAPPPPARFMASPAVTPAPAYTGLAPRTKAGVNLEGVNPSLLNFAATRDFTITSGRDAPTVHVRNSRHGDGRAVDLRVSDKTPEEVARAMEEARAAGFGVRDERYGSGTGPHIHLSAPAGGGLNLDGAEPLGSEEVGDVVTVNASQAAAPSLPPLRRREQFDAATQEGRAGRDERAQLERKPGAFLEVAAPLPAEEKLSDVAAGAEMVRSAYVKALVARGVPTSDAERVVGRDYSLKNERGEVVAPADAISDDNLDAAARTMRVKLDSAHVSKLVDDYRSGRHFGQRIADFVRDDTHSPGEKVLDVATPVASTVAKGAGYVARPFQAASAGVFSGLRGKNPLREAYNTFTTGETSAAGSNFIGNYLRDSAVLNRINPRLGRLLGGGADMILDPVNLLGLGLLGKGAKLVAGVGRAGRAAEEVSALGRALAVAERVGVAGEEAGDVAALEDRLRRVTETARKLRAGEALTPEEVALHAEVQAAAEAAPSAAVRSEQLRYVQERAAHYAQEAEGAQSRGARQAARELADDYAAEAERLKAPAAPSAEGYDLTGAEPLSPHHSHGQPRSAVGQFDGPPVSVPRRAAALAGDAADAVKSNLYSADVSAPLRQALFPLMFETRATVKGLVEGLPSVLPKYHAQFVEHMRNLPVAQEANDMGLALSSINPAAKSEYFPSRAASRLPWVGGSERVMEAQLDAVRLHVYESLTKELRAAGMTPANAREEFEGVARIVNVASGHGEPGALLGSKAAGRLLGSPRLLKSRFQVLNPLEYARLPPAARKIALRKAGRTAAAFGGLLGLGYMTADDVGLDPREGNFGQARFGNTSYDLTGGEANKIRLIFNLARSVGETAKAVRAGGSIKYEDTPVGVMTHFLRSQLSPAASLPVDAVVGKDYSGRDFTWGEQVARRVAPLMAQDIYDGFAAEGGRGALKSLPAFFGASVRQLDPEKVKKDFERANNRPVAVEVSDVASRELKRLGVDLHKLKADKVSPGFKVEGTDGETVQPMSKGERDSALVAPDVLAKDLAEEISTAVEDAVGSPDYQTFESDAARQKYLTQVVRNARARVYSSLRLAARQNQLDELRRIEDYQRRLEERSSDARRGPRTLHLDGVRESTNVEDVRPPGWRMKL
jgi:hypothetical protein